MDAKNKEESKWLSVVILAIVFTSILIYCHSNTPATTLAHRIEIDPLKQQRDLSTPSSRLVGRWINKSGDQQLYYTLTDASLKIGTSLIHNSDRNPCRPIWFKILHEEPTGEKLVLSEFKNLRKFKLHLGFRNTPSIITHIVSKHGMSMSQEYTLMGNQERSVYRYVDDKTSP